MKNPLSPPPVGGYLALLDQSLPLFVDAETGSVIQRGRDDMHAPPYRYVEATALLIDDLIELSNRTSQQRYLAAARRAGEWLTTAAWHPKGWPLCRQYLGDHDANPHLRLWAFSGGHAWLFDAACVMITLCSLADADKDAKALDHARALAENVLGILDADGGLPAIWDIANDRPARTPVPPRWSQVPMAHHARMGEALARLGITTGKTHYLEAARRIGDRALAYQAPDGRFWDPNERKTHLHAMGYAADALLRLWLALDDRRYFFAAARAVEWGLRRSCRGLIPQLFGPDGPVPVGWRTDALAQFLALGSHFRSMELLDASLETRLDWIEQAVRRQYDPAVHFFQFGHLEDGRPAPWLRAYWVTSFCLRALDLHAEATTPSAH